MKKVSIIALAIAIPSVAFAETEKSDLNLNIRRIGLDLSQTRVNNAGDYTDSPVQALKASNQNFVKGISDIALEYEHGRLDWDNTLFMEYGRTSVKPYKEKETINENADKILFSSDLSYAIYETEGLKFGPTARGQYETEFTKNDGVPRQNVARANGGFAVFDHKIIKDLHLSAVYEYDFTYSDRINNKLAAELGWRLEYEIRKGVKISTDGYYREYLDYSLYNGTDLERDLSATARLDTNLWGSFTMGPYAQYRLAKSREADTYGSNFIIGISFNYIASYGLR